MSTNADNFHAYILPTLGWVEAARVSGLMPHETIDLSRPLDAYLKAPSSYALSVGQTVRES